MYGLCGKLVFFKLVKLTDNRKGTSLLQNRYIFCKLQSTVMFYSTGPRNKHDGYYESRKKLFLLLKNNWSGYKTSNQEEMEHDNSKCNNLISTDSLVLCSMEIGEFHNDTIINGVDMAA